MEEYIGKDAESVKRELEKKGYNVEVIKCSKPKIETDSELVVSLRKDGKNITLIVGDFLIGVK